jgi:O-methyltransferase
VSSPVPVPGNRGLITESGICTSDMSLSWKIGRILNSFLKKTGIKIVSVDPKSKKTFTETRLLNALTELNAVYNYYIFDKEFTIDEESLQLLSVSMYTKYNTGFYLVNYLRQSLDLSGDVCEFGVGQGAISALLAQEIKNTDKRIWLFDLFEGFTKPLEKDIRRSEPAESGSIEWYDGAISFPEKLVRTRLDDINFPRDRIRIVPGYIEETVNGPLLPQTVCFAYVDCNFYEPTLKALQFLDTVLQPGGFMIVDDYDFLFPGVNRAVDEFFDERKDRYSMDFPETFCRTFCILSRKK